MKQLFKNGFIIALISLFLVSCNDDDDGYSLNDYWITTGTVIKTSDYYYVTTDSGDDLWPSASNVAPGYLEDGMRVFVNYTILGDEKDNTYDYFVKINSMSEILTKSVFSFTEATTNEIKDSIGYDPVTITDTWFTNDYLNIQFEYGGGAYTHFINLVKDSTDLKTEEGAIILELKHNKNNDPYNYLQWSVASFDISELQEEGQSSVEIFVKAIDKQGEYQYNKALTYEYGEETIADKSFKARDISTLMK